jgi:hypothetical protein
MNGKLLLLSLVGAAIFALAALTAAPVEAG